MKNNILTMRELPISERPYEKCEKYGTGALSDAELLAVILRTGSAGERVTELASRILMHLPGKNLAGLYRVSIEELCEIKGIGKVKAVELLCLAELVKRMVHSKLSEERLLCEEPHLVATYFMPEMRGLETEQVRLLFLDSRNLLSGEMILSSGTFNASLMSPKEVYYYAMKHKAISILLLHNHPTGDPTPSKEDFVSTARIEETGKLIGIPLLDHIIIGDNCYYSFKEQNIL